MSEQLHLVLLSVSEKSQIGQPTSVYGWNPATLMFEPPTSLDLQRSTVAELSTCRFFFGGKTSSKVPRHTDLEFAEERMFKTVDNPEGKDGWYLSNRLRMG